MKSWNLVEHWRRLVKFYKTWLSGFSLRHNYADAPGRARHATIHWLDPLLDRPSAQEGLLPVNSDVELRRRRTRRPRSGKRRIEQNGDGVVALRLSKLD